MAYHNEDHYLIAKSVRSLDILSTNLPDEDMPPRIDETGYAMLVADGMGGMAAGELASRLAISALVSIVLEVPDWILKSDEEHAKRVMARAERYYKDVNAALMERGKSDPSLSGMGTTMTLAYSIGAELFIAHVGDSRAYLLRSNQLHQLTRDHTHAQMLVEAGVLTHEQAATHRLSHVLTNAIGGAGQLKVELHRVSLLDDDRLLLCSDGLTDMVDDETIAKVMAEAPSSDEGAEQLKELALANGGRDNVTALLARYHIQS